MLLVQPHSLQGHCLAFFLSHCKPWISWWYSVFPGREIQLAPFSLLDFKIEFSFALLSFPRSHCKGQRPPTLLYILFLHPLFKLHDSIHRDLPPHLSFSLHHLPTAHHRAGWGTSRKGISSASPPPTLPTGLHPIQSSLSEVEGLSHTPSPPQWPTALWSQNTDTHSGHLFSGNFSSPYQHLTALTFLTERGLIKMTKLTLIYYHTGENSKQPWHR